MRFNLRSLFRACCVVAVLSGWYGVSMDGASWSTSWEDHPYAGPIILLKQSHWIADFLFSGAVVAAICIPAFLWIRDGSPGMIVVAGGGAALSILLTVARLISHAPLLETR